MRRLALAAVLLAALPAAAAAAPPKVVRPACGRQAAARFDSVDKALDIVCVQVAWSRTSVTVQLRVAGTFGSEPASVAGESWTARLEFRGSALQVTRQRAAVTGNYRSAATFDYTPVPCTVTMTTNTIYWSVPTRYVHLTRTSAMSLSGTSTWATLTADTWP